MRKPISAGRLKNKVSLKPRPLLGPGSDGLAHAWVAKVLTIFPNMFPGPLGESLTGKALSEGRWSIDAINLRDFGIDKHRSVDSPPAGGGPGLVMRADVLGPAIDAARQDNPKLRIIYPSPRGKVFTQAKAEELAAGEGVIMLCGRFEGIDHRVIEHYDIEEISVSDAVLTGGEIPAMAILDATVRLLPQVLGNAESIIDESFSDGLLEHPQYTRPPVWEGRAVPDVLLSGHHAKISAWRTAQSEAVTQQNRPDLWLAHKAKLEEPKQSDKAVDRKKADME